MKIISILTGMLLLLCQISLGQTLDEKLLQGKISVDSVGVNGINILNLTNGKATQTNSSGEFFILAKANDILVFTAVNLKKYRKTISFSDFELGKMSIILEPKITELKEVIVNKNEINALSLGVVTRDPVKYSPAERRLRTAGDFKPIELLQLLGGSMPLDPLINKINGRTKRLKKLVILEKKENFIKLISELFSQEYFTVQLGIANDYVNGFKYFIVENENFLKVLESKNEERTSFFMVALAQEYKDILNNEN
ncbi:hypothetical protein [Flavobacterium sp. DSR3-2]|uniref:hypothetical protein n=1 Tax=Flavobacterium sp. DSR3-2 TaxID=2804634 RepID=UPI003CF73306